MENATPSEVTNNIQDLQTPSLEVENPPPAGHPLPSHGRRRRFGSVSLDRLSDNITSSFSSLTLGGNGSSAERHPRQERSLKGLLRRASASVRRTQRRHSNAAHGARVVEEPYSSRPQTPWLRVKHAVSFQRRSRIFPDENNESLLEIDSQSDYQLPVPGTGSEPPIIPLGSGGAARATAAYQNEFLGLGLRNKKYKNLTMGEQLGDRESGIGISASSVAGDYLSDEEGDVSRIDFIESLPVELSSQILSLLDLSSIMKAILVSKPWQQIIDSTHVWRPIFLREMSKTYAMSTLPALGAGLGLPVFKPDIDWKELYQVRQKLDENWMMGNAQPRYLSGHLDSIYCVQFDESKIITGSRDRTIRVWDMKTYACKLVIGPRNVITRPDILTCAHGKPQHFVMTPQMKRTTESTPELLSFDISHSQSILCLQYDETILVTGSSDGTCIIYDINNGYTPITRLLHHTAAVLDLAFDDRYIITCSKDLTICIWDRDTFQMIKQLRGHNGPVNAVQLRGNSIVSCSGDFKVKLWNIDTGKNIREFVGHNKGLACSQFSDDSRFIASAGNDKMIKIWDSRTGDLLHSFHAHDNLVRSLHIDSFSGRLISGSYDQDIKVWDMKTGRLLLDFPRWHASWVLGAKSDYRRIISTGQDAKVLVMDFGHGIEGIEKLSSCK